MGRNNRLTGKLLPFSKVDTDAIKALDGLNLIDANNHFLVLPAAGNGLFNLAPVELNDPVYADGPVHANGPSIPALLKPWPTTPTTSTPITVGSTYTVAGGTVIYATGLPTITAGQATFFKMSIATGELINNGEVWVRDSQSVGFRWGAAGSTIHNNGLVVVESTSGNAYGMYDSLDVGPSVGTLHNAGQLYVFAKNSAYGISGQALNNAIYLNDGLIAVQSATATATGFEYGSPYGITGRNSATGLIAVEGVSAIGVYLHNNVVFTNQGSITARTIANPTTGLIENYSIGIVGYVSPSGADRHVEINNSGTITADIAIQGYSISGYSHLRNYMVVNNLAGGALNGAVVLDFTNDIINNMGSINGAIDMREGNDVLDTATGVINGLIDMGFGNDVFRGSVGADTVLGNRNDDELHGAGGDDLLLGGNGRDLLEGGIGNDGLYGEYEDDVIITLGGDVVSGGDGDDRIELGDYTFRAIDGGDGTDTLVLATGARVLDWHAVVASGRVSGIEAVTMRGGQQLVLGAADLTGLPGGRFIVTSTASDTLSLLGAWSESAATVLGGISYRTFDQGKAHVLVAGGGAVATNATMPSNAAGLDAIAGGNVPALPGSMPGADLTSGVWVGQDYDVGNDFVIDPSEIWINNVDAQFGVRSNIFSIYDSIDFTNNGTILASVIGSYREVDIGFLNSFTNNGYLGLTQTGPGPDQPNGGSVQAIAIQQHGTVLNTGTINIETVGSAWAVASSSGDRSIIVNPVETITIPAFENRGDISVISHDESAFGAQLSNGQTAINSGTMTVIAPNAAIALDMGFTFRSLVNSGRISVSISPGGTGGMGSAIGAVGVRLNGITTNSNYVPTINNTGVIEAATAISVSGSGQANFVLTNSNRITGTVNLVNTIDTVTNTGLIDGTVNFGSGNDSYNGSGGTVTGIVFGGEGNDALTGGSAADWFEGGAGDDVLNGGSGADRALYTEATSAVSVDLRITGAQNTGGAGTDTLTNIEGLVGSAYNDTLTGNADANFIDGGAGNDIMIGYGGNDTIDGGAGTNDEARYAGNFVDYVIENIVVSGVHYTRVTGTGAFAGDGVDILQNVEFIQFADTRVSLGVSSNNRPILGQPAMVDQSVDDSTVYSYQIPATSFIDLDQDDVLSFRATLSNGAALPVWLTFNSSTRTFSGTPPISAIGSVLSIRVFASDNDPGDPGYEISDDFVLTITQAAGANVLGTAGDDILSGTFRNETMIGLAGNDIFNGSAGADWIDGGADVDTVDYSTSAAAVTINLGSGVASGGDAQGDFLASIERAVGSNFDDNMTGTLGADSLSGGGGADTLIGLDGDDRLDGGAGVDNMSGGIGNDIYVVDNVGDIVTEAAGEGTDTVMTSVAYTLTANVENLTVTGTNALVVRGNAQNNIITGNAAASTLNGGLGNDRFIIGTGANGTIVNGGSDIDTLAVTGSVTLGGLIAVEAIELTNNAVLTLTAAQFNTGLAANSTVIGTGSLVINMGVGDGAVSLQPLIGVAATVNGSTGNDIITTGNSAAASTLNGGLGNDRFILGAGANGTIVNGGADIDTLVVTGSVSLGGLSGVEAIEFSGGAALTLTGAQFITGLAATSTLSGAGSLIINMGPGDSELYLQQLVVAGGSSITATVNGSTGNDVIKGLIGAVNTISGGEGLDSIRGGTMDDILNGGNGDDKIEGGRGADILTGGAGADVFRYQSTNATGVGAAADQITDFVAGTDKLGFALLDPDPVTPGDQAFSFIGTGAFHANGAAEIRYGDSGGDILVQADVNGDGVVDMEIILQGIAGQPLTSGDFVL